MGRYGEHSPVIEHDGLTSSEFLLVQELDSLADSGVGQFLRKENGSIVNANGDGPQTTWTSDIDAGGFNLLNLGATALTIAGFDSSKNLVSLPVATYPSLTELSYVKGVTSAIQTQLNGKQASGTYITDVTGTLNRITSSGGTTPQIDISATFEALLGKVANPLSQFAATTSAQLAGVISDETGSGLLVFGTSPVLLGNPTAPTQSQADNSTKIATTAYVDLAISPVDVVVQGRLTLTTGTPVITSSVTAATTLYFALFNGDNISLYDGTQWKRQRFTEQSILLTDAQTGTTTNLSKVVTGLTSTSQLVRGMLVTGINVGVGAVISSIDSTTQVTVSVNSTGSASNTMTFKLNTSTNYDVFFVQATGKLQLSNAWTNGITRADAISTQNGIYVNTSAINATDSNTIAATTGLYLGTIQTTGTAGQTECSFVKDSVAGATVKWFVWNLYNPIPVDMFIYDSTNSWNYTTATWRAANASNNNRIEYVQGLSLGQIKAEVKGSASNNTNTVNASVGVGIDATDANSAQVEGAAAGLNFPYASYAIYSGYPGIGYHYLQWLEISQAGIGITTFTGDNGQTYRQAGMRVTVSS